MSGMNRKGRGRPSHCGALSTTNSKSNCGPTGRKPRAPGIDNDSRSSTPVSVASGGASSRVSARLAASGKSHITHGSRKKARRFAEEIVYDEDEDLEMEVDFHDPEDSRSNSGAEDEEANDDLDASFDETGSVWSEATDETSASNLSKLKLLPRRPKSPEFIDDEDIPPLELPESSNDLFVDGQNLMQALGVYEVMRRFSVNLRMSPFRFEDFCAALCTDEQSSLLVEMHLMLLKSLLREDDGNNTLFGPQDIKDSINVLLYMVDSMTWFEIIRAYLESDFSPEFSQALPSLEKTSYSSLSLSERLQILVTLTNLFLSTNPVREEITNEGNINYDDHCRSCHRLGDLLCCDTCPAVYHLACLDLPEVPEDDWICTVCKTHQLKGVTDCVSEVEKSGLLCRQEPIGYDRHCHKYWFLCRRIIVEDEEEVRYYSTRLQLEELIESLDGERYEKDLVSALKEMKEEIVRQMTITEELTKEHQGSRKSALEIANANILKLQAERAAKMEEEKRKKQEEEEQSAVNPDSEQLEDTATRDSGNNESIESDVHMEVDEIKEEVTEVSATAGKSELNSPQSVVSKCDSAIKAEPKTETVEAKADADVTSNAGSVKDDDCQSEADALKSEKKDTVEVKTNDMGPKIGSNSTSKAVMVISKDGGKMLMSLVRPSNGGLDKTVDAVSSANQESISAVTSEGRRIVTRSKTGSLTPKQFADSVTLAMTTKAGGKAGHEENSVGARSDGDGMRLTRSKTAMSASSFLLSQSLYFKLGAEGSYKQYVNQYSTNPLALNKNQHNEEREKKRHLSHKFSLTPVSEFNWNGSTFGFGSLLLGTLRQTILQLESNLPLPFLHLNWSQHRARWTKLVNSAARPEDFANVLMMLESSMKPVLFNQVWHEALGHTKLRRTPVLDREEVKKREREQRRRKDEEEEPGKNANSWVKFSLGLRHQVWKQKGEEYRVLGHGGWMWISVTRVSRYVPATSVGLRVLAAKLQARKQKALEKKRAMEDSKSLEGEVSSTELGDNGKPEAILNEKSGLMMMEENIDEPKDPDEDMEVDDVEGVKVEMENFDISKALVNRTHYSRITKPYSRLEHLLDRRMKLAELEQKQRSVFEQLIKHYYHARAEKNEQVANFQSNDSICDVNSVFSNNRDVKQMGPCAGDIPVSGAGKYQCYSASCRNRIAGESRASHNCYSVLCRQLTNWPAAANNIIDKLPSLDLANGDIGEAESDDEEGCNDNEVSLDHEDKDDGLITSQLNSFSDNSSVYADLMKIRNRLAESQNAEKSVKSGNRRSLLTKDELNSKGLLSLKNAHGKEDALSQSRGAGVLNSGLTLISLASFFQDGKLKLTPDLVHQLEARILQMGRTELPVVLTKRGPGRPSKTTSTARPYGLLKKGAIPSVIRFLTPSKKASLFVLRKHFLLSLARREGKRETPGFNYSCKMNNVNWLYPCPRPYFKTSWEYRTMTMKNLPAVAAQLRVMWACIRWDDLNAKVPPSGTNTITTETDITTTKLLKRRDVGPYGLRSEFLVRKIVIPISVPSQTREKYTPQRSGLRERRRPESPKQKEPSVAETWIPEEQLDLWEIKLFGDRIEKQNLMAQEKKSQQQKQAAAEAAQKAASLDKSKLDEQLKTQRISVGLKRTADGQLKTVDAGQKLSLGSGGIGLKTLSTSSSAAVRMIQIQQPAQRSLLAGSSSQLTTSASTPAGGTSVPQTVQNLRIVHGPNGQLQVQGLLPGQQIIRLPNGQLHLVTTASKPQQPPQLQTKSSHSLLLSSQATPSSETESTGTVAAAPSTSFTPTTILAKAGPAAADVSASPSASAAKGLAGSIAVIGGQRIVLAGGSILSTQASAAGTAVKPAGQQQQQVLSKVVVAPGGSLQGQKQQLFVTSGSTPKMVKLPIQLQQSQQPTKVVLPSGQVLSGQPTVIRTSSGQHYIIQPGVTLQQKVQVAATPVATPSVVVESASAGGVLADAPNSLMSSVSLSTSPSATSPTKYTVTPQVLQQVVNQALMQTQDPEITAKLLAMQKIMQQQTSLTTNDADVNSQQIQLKTQQPHLLKGAGFVTPVKHQKGLSHELKEEQARLSTCSQVIKGILDNVEKHEKHELKKQRKQETSDEKVRRILLQKLEGQLGKRKETIKREILRKRNILEKTITTKLQAEVAQIMETRVVRKTVPAKRNRSDVNIKVEVPPPLTAAPISIVTTPPVACELEVKEPKSKRRKQKSGSAGKRADVKTENPDEKLYCLCKTPYDESKFYIGCDRCEDWFHGSCVGVTKSEADRMDTYICPSCRTTSGDGAVNQTRLQDHHQHELGKLLNMIKSHRMSWPFREPVCPKEVPDYYTVIKEPMDLSTVESKLMSHRYSTLGEFVKDVTKIFDNCRYYNPSNSQFYRSAETLEIYFVEKLKVLKEKLHL